MSWQRVTGCATLLALLLAVCAASAASPEHGKAVYMKMGCWQCHGTVGQGGAGPRIAPDPIPDLLPSSPPARSAAGASKPADAASIPLLQP